jgi:hypothetical protein
VLGKLSRRTRKRLEENGKHAPAVVLEIAERGMSVTSGNENIVANTEVVLKTKLRVEPPDEPPFEVEEKFRYPQLSIPAAGSHLAVIYDPGDHETIMLDTSAAGAAVQFAGAAGMGGMDMEALMSRIQEAQSQTQDPQELARLLREQLGTNVSVESEDSTRAAFGPAQAFPTTPAFPSAQGEDPVDKLTKLGELKEKGLLTDAEFEAQKARILGES